MNERRLEAALRDSLRVVLIAFALLLMPYVMLVDSTSMWHYALLLVVAMLVGNVYLAVRHPQVVGLQ